MFDSTYSSVAFDFPKMTILSAEEDSFIMLFGQGDLGIFLLGISTKRLVYLIRAWYLVKALSIWRKDLLYRERPWYIEDSLGI